MTHDVIFTNARVVDGTGAPWFRGTVGVRNGDVVTVTRERNPGLDAEEAVDLDGAVLAPGFVDTHSHSDLELFSDPTLEPKVRQGVTTEILGQDGFSMAPMYREDGPSEWRSHLAALAGDSERSWSWASVGDYLEAVEIAGVAPNVGTLVGHGTVRFNVLGMADRAPTATERREMADLVSEALADGALGFSTGLIYPPQVNADTQEVRALARRLAPHGRPFVAHVRSEGRWIWEALDEFVEVGAEAGVPVHLSHFKLGGRAQHGKVDRALARIEAARERGVDFTAEQYPYAAGSTMLSSLLPPWVHADGPDELLSRLEDPAVRERIRRDVTEWRVDGWENIGGLAGWENVVVANVQSDANRDLEGESIAAVADARGVEPLDAVCDLLVEEELGVSIVAHAMDEGDVRDILASERVCVGTDGLFGGRPHPRVYGSYPRILGRYVREENLLTLEEAVRKMTSLPARAMGLDRKGVVRPGMDADLVVFDPATVESRATYDRPRRHPRGVEHVVVAGEFVVRDGDVTGATPGSVLRA